MTSLVGIDVGTSSVKAIAISREGRVRARAEEPLDLVVPRPGWAEQDPDDWWRATQAVLARLDVGDVAGIGLSGQMHGLVALDEHMDVLRPAILWNDGRTGEECREIERRVGAERLVALTGNAALAGFTAPKLLWLRNHEPDAFARISHVLLPKDYVRFRLTGELATDASDASGTLLLDVANRRWSEEVLAALDLDASWLSPVLESPAPPGATRAGVPLAAGAGDQAAGALGVGVDAPGSLAVTLGTSGVVFAPTETFLADERARLHSFCHSVPGTWHVMGVTLSAAGSLRWARDVLAPGAPFDELVAEAEPWPPGAEGAAFAPYLAGERTPHADPDARGAFTGLSLHHERGALVRAVLEGVAFALRDSLELGRELGVSASSARASGGGTRGGLWNRIVASVLGLRLELTEAQEGAAFGAALLGGAAAGVFEDTSAAVASCVRVRADVEPDPEWRDAYEEGYRRFRSLYPALRSL
ncbi:MAG TPA: xylulokinase [Actinomycetota bacterium]|nr:xylulokinase [Actinomycetota bacterium]